MSTILDHDKFSPSIRGLYDPAGYYRLGGLLRISMGKKRKEYRAKQKEITKKTGKLNYADEEYYLTSEYLLKLASNVGKLFKSSEVHEKRLLLKMALQNLELKGKKVRYDWINPFDKIASYTSRQAWLPLKDLFINQKIEFGITLSDLKIFVSSLSQADSLKNYNFLPTGK